MTIICLSWCAYMRAQMLQSRADAAGEAVSQARAELAEERGKLKEMAEAEREERKRWVKEILYAGRGAGARKEGASEGILCGFVREVRGGARGAQAVGAWSCSLMKRSPAALISLTRVCALPASWSARPQRLLQNLRPLHYSKVTRLD